jgi:hypothetical protein
MFCIRYNNDKHVCYLFNKINASLQVHTEVDEFPLDTFFLVFFLFQYEHVMVEELLESLIGVVDAQLLKTIEL